MLKIFILVADHFMHFGCCLHTKPIKREMNTLKVKNTVWLKDPRGLKDKCIYFLKIKMFSL